MLADDRATSPRARRYFCSGCPHNTSTMVPEGSRAYAGIGCHYMALWMDRNDRRLHPDGRRGRQLGRRGAVLDARARLPESRRRHLQPFRLAGAPLAPSPPSANITYKILFNDAVAMTGGQPHEGGLTVDMIARQVARRRRRAHRASSPTSRTNIRRASQWPPAPTIHHRDDLDARAARACARSPASSVLIYDQTCAAEKRRRRKRGTFPDPTSASSSTNSSARAAAIAACSRTASRCSRSRPSSAASARSTSRAATRTSPASTASARPSSPCMAPSSRKAERVAGTDRRARRRCRSPPIPARSSKPSAIIVTGVGGTGVVTIGAILGMAAHLEGKGCGMIDMAGLAQKGGAVFSHVRIAHDPDDIHAIRVAGRRGRSRARLRPRRLRRQEGARRGARRATPIFVVNTAEIMPGDFTRNADFSLPAERLKARDHARPPASEQGAFRRRDRASRPRCSAIRIGANMFMLGFACQHGGVPLSAAAIEQAIELNGEAVAMNIAAFRWGRRAAHRARMSSQAHGASRGEPTRPRAAVADARRDHRPPRRFPDRLSERRLCASATPSGSRACARPKPRPSPGSTALTEAVARNLFKLMAFKDEYEVGAALHRRLLRRSRSPRLRRRRTCATNSTSRRRSSPAATRRRACRGR